MRRFTIILLASFLSACSDGGRAGDTATVGTGPNTYPSSFEAAKYNAKTLTVLPEEEGYDLDGDGVADNKLPTLLALVDPFSDDDLSREGVNRTIAEMQAEGQLILLLDVIYTAGDLTVDLLLAVRDEDTDVLSMDPSSYADDGTPNSRFSGAFEDETNFSTNAAKANLPFPVVVGDPPVQIPVLDALLEGEFYSFDSTIMDSGQTTAGHGVMVGALPVQGLVDQVVEKIVPQEEPNSGADPDVTYYVPADYLNMSREEFILWVTDLLNDNIADLWLDDGSRAVSAALEWEVEWPTEWPAD